MDSLIGELLTGVLKVSGNKSIKLVECGWYRNIKTQVETSVYASKVPETARILVIYH